MADASVMAVVWSLLRQCISWGAAAVAAALVSGTAWLMTRSLDRTDESYYLLAVARPEDDEATLLLFGWLLHPLYDLLGGDVVALRWAGLALSASLVGWFAWVLLGVCSRPGRPRPDLRTALIVMVTWAAGVLWLFLQMPMSPGYNMVTFNGLCLLATGAVMILGRPQSSGWAGPLLVGVGGAVISFAKLPTALGASVLVAVVFLAARPRRVRALGISVAAALGTTMVVLVLSGLAPGEVAGRLMAGLRYQNLLESHTSLFRVDPFPTPTPLAWSRGFWLPAFTVVVLLVPAIDGLVRRLRSRRHLVGAHVGRDEGVLVILLVMLPVAYAFGTNTNLWVAMGRASVFWVAAATLAVTSHRSRPDSLRTLFPGLLTLVLLVPMFTAAAAVPWRYPTFQGADAMTHVDVRGSVVGLVPSDAKATTRRLEAVQRLGLEPGQRVLDLTGAGPAYLNEWGARPVGRAYLLGGYPGSDAAAREILANHRCEAQGAWVLTSDDGATSLDASVLEVLGRDLHADYVRRASFAGSPTSPFTAEPVTLTLWSPEAALPQEGCRDAS